MIRKAAALIALGLTSMPITVLAVPVLQGPTDAATGITNLEIDGALYDVTFSTGDISFDDFFGGASPIFLGDPTDSSAALAAAASIRAFFESTGVSSVTNLDALNPADPFRVVFVPTFIDFFGPGQPSLVTAANVVYDGTTWSSGGFGRTGSGPINPPGVAWARFMPVRVAEPGSLLLISLGLAILGLARRRSRRCR